MSKPFIQRLGDLFREVAVIVAGVTLALGADAFYDLTRDRSERRRILRSFDADLRVDSVAYARALEASLDMAVNAASGLLALIEDPNGHVSRVELGRLIRESILSPAGLKESATYREVTTTGTIGLIGDPALREALLSYYSRPFSGLPSEIWAAYVADINGAYERSLRAHMGSGYIALLACIPSSGEYEGCLEQASVGLDLVPLRSDPLFVEQLVGMALWAGRFKNYVAGQSAEHRGLAAQVRDAIADS